MSTNIEDSPNNVAEAVASVRTAALVVNTKSRRGEEWFAQVKERLLLGGMELTEAIALKNPKKLKSEVARLIATGVSMVIVGGGDGTFSAIARLFARKQTILGVLPLGTGNAFARDLQIPAQVETACDTILNGKLAQIDLGIVGDQDFVNVATIGLSTLIAQGLEPGLKKKLGRAVYLLSVVRALSLIRPFNVKLEIPGPDGKGVVHEFECLQLVIGNGHFHAGPFPVAPDASITGGWLSIYALASTRRLAFLKMAFYMAFGKHIDLDEVKTFRVHSGKLSASPKQKITVDGEVVQSTPVDFRVMKGALRVMVPESFQSSSG